MRRPALHYAWLVAGVTFFVLLVGAGVRATPGVLILPLERAFGWTDATISAAVAVNLLLYGLMGPFAVAIIERFGLRRTVSGALLLLAVGTGLTVFMRAPWQLMVLWGFVVGAGSGMTAVVLGAVVAQRWFAARRGLVLGLMTASSATGQLVFLPMLASVAEHLGWRAVSVVLAVVTLAITLLAALALRDRPADLGLAPYGADAIETAEHAPINPLWRALQALGVGVRSFDFWLISGTFFVCGASTNGLIGTHLITICGDHGVPEVQAAGLLAMMGVFDLFGTTASGWLTDRVDSRFLLFWYYGLRGLSLIYLPVGFILTGYGLPLFAVFYGLDWVATVPPTIRLAENSFGKENAAVMFGWIAAAHQIGAASAAWAAGFLRTITGSYFDAITAVGAICLIAAALTPFIGMGRGTRRPLSALAERAACTTTGNCG